MQAASDVFLGWMTGPVGPHYYWRQLWDAKISADLETMKPAGLLSYARICGWALARAHARSGNPAAIAAYLGTSGRFERAMLDFSEAPTRTRPSSTTRRCGRRSTAGASRSTSGI